MHGGFWASTCATVQSSASTVWELQSMRRFQNQKWPLTIQNSAHSCKKYNNLKSPYSHLAKIKIISRLITFVYNRKLYPSLIDKINYCECGITFSWDISLRHWVLFPNIVQIDVWNLKIGILHDVETLKIQTVMEHNISEEGKSYLHLFESL